MLTALDQLLIHENKAVLRSPEQHKKRKELREHLEFLKQVNRHFTILEARITKRKANYKYPYRRIVPIQIKLF